MHHTSKTDRLWEVSGLETIKLLNHDGFRCRDDSFDMAGVGPCFRHGCIVSEIMWVGSDMLHPIRKHTLRVGQLKLKHSSAMMIWHLLIDKVLRYNGQSYSMFLCQTSKRLWDWCVPISMRQTGLVELRLSWQWRCWDKKRDPIIGLVLWKICDNLRKQNTLKPSLEPVLAMALEGSCDPLKKGCTMPKPDWWEEKATLLARGWSFWFPCISGSSGGTRCRISHGSQLENPQSRDSSDELHAD